MKKPQILIIGDSISMGYLEPVRKILEEKAEVHRPEGNCASTLEGLEHLSEWLNPGPWDIIHFNWGLHDLKYMGPNGENLADPHDPKSRQKVPPVAYGENLAALVDRLSETEASLIWCNTTPVPPGAQGRIPGDSAIYNDIAAKLMKEREIAIDDLYTYAMSRLEEIQQPENVHFSEQGSEVLAEHVAGCIFKAIEKS